MKRKHKLLIVFVALFLLAGAALFSISQNNSKSKSVSIPTKENDQKIAQTSPEKVKAENYTDNNEKNSTASSGNLNSTLVTPYGTFVSNHKPSLRNSVSPSSEESVCITTPGASCTIIFTNVKDNTNKKLDAKLADNKGTVYWSWDVKEAGFYAGTWKIQAIATSNGQSKSSEDSLGLEVLP